MNIDGMMKAVRDAATMDAVVAALRGGAADATFEQRLAAAGLQSQELPTGLKRDKRFMVSRSDGGQDAAVVAQSGSAYRLLQPASDDGLTADVRAVVDAMNGAVADKLGKAAAESGNADDYAAAPALVLPASVADQPLSAFEGQDLATVRGNASGGGTFTGTLRLKRLTGERREMFDVLVKIPKVRPESLTRVSESMTVKALADLLAVDMDHLKLDFSRLAPDDALLSTYSEAELAERDKARRDAEAAAQVQRDAEERRAQADRERDDFRLSGSDSASDVAASYGQADMLGASAPPDDAGQREPDDFPGPRGKEMTVKTAKGTKVDTRFTILEADDLIASHTADGRENPAFPQALQPRDRSRDASRAWIQKTAKDLDPGLLGKTKKADSGAPIIGKDRVVESGNGRTLAIMEAYRLGTADEYRQWLVEDADSYGLDSARVAAMKAPVLVRVRTSDIDREAFAVEANQDDKLSMSATEKARADANRLTPELMAKFDPGADGDLLVASNRGFIQGFLQSLGDAEAAQYLTSTGDFTGPLIARIQAAVFAKAYQDERLLELMADSAKPENRNIIAALSAAAPEFIQARTANESAAQGTAEQLASSVEMSLDSEAVKSLIDATNVVRQAKRDGMDVAEYVSQMGLFGDVDPGVAAMAVFIAQNNRSAKRMSTAFKAMAAFVRQELERDNAAGGDMFGEAPVSMSDVVEAANRVMEREYGEGQYRIDASPPSGGLFESVASENLQRIDIDAAAATTDPSPSPAQAAAGNYRKGKVSIHGLTIAIENPKGTVRRGVDPDGTEWANELACHYGDIKGARGADGDNLDVFLGDNPASRVVYVVDQMTPDGAFDEHKIMLGFDSLEAARAGYLASYEDGWQGLGDITRASLPGFKAWLRRGDPSRPFHAQGNAGIFESAAAIRRRALQDYLLG